LSQDLGKTGRDSAPDSIPSRPRRLAKPLSSLGEPLKGRTLGGMRVCEMINEGRRFEYDPVTISDGI